MYKSRVLWYYFLVSNTTQTPPAFNLESQKQLARLLAKENIMIRVGNYSTAFFDVKNRVLGLPSWNVSDKNVADLLVGHEVGHALHTPIDAHAEFTARYPKAPFDVANIVEDIRIERLIQENFPGLITPFRNGYSYFIEQDFFKIAGKDLSQMSFLDRLNLKGKLRNQVSITFSPEEQALFEACDATQTWSDVLEVCGRIIDFIECEKNLSPQMPKPSQGEDQKSAPSSNSEGGDRDDDTQNLSHSQSNDSSESESSESDSSGEESKTEGDSESESGNESTSESSDTSASESQANENQKKQQAAEESKDSQNAGNGKNFKTPVNYNSAEYSCSTQQNFDSELNKLHEGNDYSTVNTPIPADFAKCINNIKKVRYERQNRLSRYNDAMTNAEYNDRWNEFKKSSKSTVASFVKEFERKKSAYEYSRATIATTGQINVNKLHAYRYDDQIFKSVSRLAQSKSHGMAFFLDCSQSMEGVIRDVVKQTLELVWFCKSVGIPFVVYGFTSIYETYDVREARLGDNIDFRWATVNELLNSELNKAEFETASKELFLNYVVGRNLFGSHIETMSGTPLYETTIIAAHLVNAFRAKTGVQKMNTIFISDGDGGNLSVIKNSAGVAYDKDNSSRSYSTQRSFVWHKQKINFFVREANDKAEMASRLMRDFKAITGSNTLCFFLPTGGKKDLIAKCSNAYISSTSFPNIKTWSEGYAAYEKNLKASRSANERVIYIPGGFGFDGYFVMRDAYSGVKLADDEFTISDLDTESRAGRNKLAKEFTKHTTSKKQSRVFLSKFMDLIA